MYALVFSYVFNVCETFIMELNGGRDFLALCYWFSRLVDYRTDNKNIDVCCNYLQQNV